MFYRFYLLQCDLAMGHVNYRSVIKVEIYRDAAFAVKEICDIDLGQPFVNLRFPVFSRKHMSRGNIEARRIKRYVNCRSVWEPAASVFHPLLKKGAYPLVAEVFREESGQLGFTWNVVKLSIVVI